MFWNVLGIRKVPVLSSQDIETVSSSVVFIVAACSPDVWDDATVLKHVHKFF